MYQRERFYETSKKDKVKGDNMEFKLKEGCEFDHDNSIDRDKFGKDVTQIRIDSENPKEFQVSVLSYLKKRPNIYTQLNMSKPDKLAKDLTKFTVLREMMGSDDALELMSHLKRTKKSGVLGIAVGIDKNLKEAMLGQGIIELSLDDIDLEENELIDVHIEGNA